jgi:hypothetical protein
MLPHEGHLPPSIDHHQLSAMVQKTNALRAALRRREPRCRICREDAVRVRVDALLDWVGVPIPKGTNKFHVITYADVLRDLEPLNARRPLKDRITYDSLWVHAKRHYDLKGLVDHLAMQVKQEFDAIFGIPLEGSAQSAAHPGPNQVRQTSDPIHTLLEAMLNQSSNGLDGHGEIRLP